MLKVNKKKKITTIVLLFIAYYIVTETYEIRVVSTYILYYV